MSERIQKIISSYRQEHPLKRKEPRETWKNKMPQEYQAAKLLWREGYCIRQIADLFKINYSTIRRAFIRDGIITLINDPVKKQKVEVKSQSKINPGLNCPCGIGMKEICSTHKGNGGI